MPGKHTASRGRRDNSRPIGEAEVTGTRLAVRTTTTGLLLALYPLGQFLGNPLLGALSDRYGRRPIMLTDRMSNEENADTDRADVKLTGQMSTTDVR